MTILVIFFFLGNLFISCLTAQSTKVNNSDFKKLTHQWKGNLQYLNYQDDEKKVTIPCTMSTKFKGRKLRVKITFDEMKEGKKMTSQSSFRISKNKKYLLVDKEKWVISSNEKTKDRIKIIATKRGKDNNRPSDLRMTLTIEDGNAMTWRKDVKYDGTDTFFNRNQFSFNF